MVIVLLLVIVPPLWNCSRSPCSTWQFDPCLPAQNKLWVVKHCKELNQTHQLSSFTNLALLHLEFAASKWKLWEEKNEHFKINYNNQFYYFRSRKLPFSSHVTFPPKPSGWLHIISCVPFTRENDWFTALANDKQEWNLASSIYQNLLGAQCARVKENDKHL